MVKPRAERDPLPSLLIPLHGLSAQLSRPPQPLRGAACPVQTPLAGTRAQLSQRWPSGDAEAQLCPPRHCHGLSLPRGLRSSSATLPAPLRATRLVPSWRAGGSGAKHHLSPCQELQSRGAVPSHAALLQRAPIQHRQSAPSRPRLAAQDNIWELLKRSMANIVSFSRFSVL